MINPQLLDYIKKQLEQGVSKEEIKRALVSNGWQDRDVEGAFLMPAPQGTISSLPGATAILGQAFSIYKQRLGTFLGVSIILPLFGFILSVFFGLLAVFYQRPAVSARLHSACLSH